MSLSFEEIIEACWPTLQSVGYHTTQAQRERRFITAYQIWQTLKNNRDPFCEILIAECGGDYVGEEAGSHVGPAQKIAQALGRGSNQIETRYLDTRYLQINGDGDKPTGQDCGLFRLVE